MTMKSYIYRLRNRNNDKNYVGQAKRPERRKKCHFGTAKKGDVRPLYASIRKHGEQAFEFEILEECDQLIADQREQYWIAFYDSFNPEKGYNLTSGGGHGFYVRRAPMTEEHKQKISESLKGHEGYWTGKSHDSESNRKRSEKMKGRPKGPFSEEHKRRISESKMGSIPWNKGRKKVDS